MRMKIKLNTISKVKDFVKLVNQTKLRVFIEHESYMIDANSIMGIFSMDIMEDMVLFIELQYTDDWKTIENFKNELNKIGVLCE